MYYNLNKISLSRGGLYIDSPEWQKTKKATIHSKNSDDKCFQYALTVALKYQNIKNNSDRISKIKPFTDKYNWTETIFPSHKKDWEKFELNTKSITFDILYIPDNTKEIRYSYKSKYNLERENQVILLMITDSKKWHYLAIKNCLYFYCLIVFVHTVQKINFKNIKEYVEIMIIAM